jgi:hypothetical protein
MLPTDILTGEELAGEAFSRLLSQHTSPDLTHDWELFITFFHNFFQISRLLAPSSRSCAIVRIKNPLSRLVYCRFANSSRTFEIVTVHWLQILPDSNKPHLSTNYLVARLDCKYIGCIENCSKLMWWYRSRLENYIDYDTNVCPDLTPCQVFLYPTSQEKLKN